MFKMEIERPVNLGCFDPDDTTLSEAIYSIYSDVGGYVTLNWNGCDLSISFNALSEMCKDIVDMLKRINVGKSFIQNFLCSEFTAEWDIQVSDENLKIKAKWTDVAERNVSEKKLRDVSNIINVNRENFINTWTGLLDIVEYDLKKMGYEYRFF